MTRPLRPCGTYAAYMRHKKAGEPTCQPCRDANAARQRGYRKTATGPRKLAPCGTEAARQRHRRRGETCHTCDDARTARIEALTPAPKPKPRVTKNRDISSATWMYGPIPPPDPHLARQAALTACDNAHDTDDARLLLDTLGVLDVLRREKEAA